jgi:hypothetical protein
MMHGSLRLALNRVGRFYWRTCLRGKSEKETSMLDFVTPELFDRLILANLALGVVLAGIRFYRDMKRPLPNPRSSQHYDDLALNVEDTQLNRVKSGKK